MRCVLIGNYGAGNIGDEILKEYFLSTFPEISWTVVSAKPKEENEVPRLPLGFRSVFRPWWRTIAAIRRSDAVVFGGGSLFTDIESVYACRLWWWHGFVAHLFGKPVLLANQGIGPFTTGRGQRRAESTAQRAAFISVRDPESLKRVEGWNLTATLSTDPAFAYFTRGNSLPPLQKKVLVLIPRANSDFAFLLEAEKYAKQEFDSIKILLMQPRDERKIADKLQLLIPAAGVTAVTSPQQLREEISAAHTVVTQRYHGAVAALSLGRETVIVPQAAGDKLSTLMGAGDMEQLRTAVRSGEKALSEALSRIDAH